MTKPSPTILIVDDEKKNCKLFETLLQSEGYLTLTAYSGREALALIAQRPPDLILLDISMPEMDGYEVATLLKSDAATSDIPIIMITAHRGRSARLVGLNAGADEFLTKPIDRAELSIRVRNLLRIKENSIFLKNNSLIVEQQVDARIAELTLFRKALDSGAEAILLMDRSSMRNIEVNATATQTFGYSREELLAIDPGKLCLMARVELEEIYDAAIANPGKITVSQIPLQRKDGSRFPAEVHWRAIRQGSQWIIAWVTRELASPQP